MNEYWTVIENKTGKVICNCGDLNDAMMMVSFDSNNRSYKRNCLLMDEVIDVSLITYKQLSGQRGLPAGKINQLSPYRKKLPEGQQKPVII